MDALRSVLFLFLFVGFSYSDGGVTIISPPEIEGLYLSGPLSLSPKSFSVEGLLAYAPTFCKFDELTDDDIAKLNGKIVLFPSKFSKVGFTIQTMFKRRCMSKKIWRQSQRGNEMECNWSNYAWLH
jgi:hypothetical protein